MSEKTVEATLAAVREVILRCETCGKIHELRKRNKFEEDTFMTWASPDDGHAYRRRWLDLHEEDANAIVTLTRRVLAEEPKR